MIRFLIKDYYHVLGTIYIAFAILIFFFKSEFRVDKEKRKFRLFEIKANEKDAQPDDKPNISILEAYKMLLKIFRVKHIPLLIVFLMTLRVNFSSSKGI